jgi:hypothetical protein
MSMAMGPADDQNFDPRRIPADKRVAYVNKVVDRLEGANAAADYEIIAACLTDASDLPDETASETRKAACDHLAGNAYALALADSWKKSESKVIDDWLMANTKALRQSRHATSLDRCYRPYPEAAGGISDAVTELRPVVPLRLPILLAVKANQDAMHGRWDEAYRWNFRVLQIAAHAYQQPAFIDQAVGRRAEMVAYRQLFGFLNRHDPADRLLDQVDDIYMWDEIEVAYRWAEKPEACPKHGETIQGLLGDSRPYSVLKEIGVIPVFRSTKKYRKALQASSAERDWETFQQAAEIAGAWDRRPFHEAWADVEAFRTRYCETVRAAPSIAVYGCPGIVKPGATRCIGASIDALRGAVETVMAIKQFRDKAGKLPESLDKLQPPFTPASAIDPFSGKPFVYRQTDDGKDFILYSVSSDQKDDGGRHNSDWNKEGDYVFWPPQPPEITSRN